MARGSKTGTAAAWLLMAGALAPAAPAWAQEGAVDQVVVTATRSPTSLRSLAGNTTRLSRAEIERIRAEHPSELLNEVPGVFIHRNSGQEHLTAIRSPVLTGGAGAGSFLFLEDGVPLRAAGFANVNGLFEAHFEVADAVEVVRGPGSAFYGSNAVHGLINVVSRVPGDGPAYAVDVSAGSYGRVNGSAIASLSSGNQGLFAGITLAHEDGFRAHASIDSQKITLRHDTAIGAVKLRTRFTAINLNQETAGFIEGPNAYKSTVLARSNPNPEAFRDATALRFSSRAEIPLGSATLAFTPFARWNEMAFLLHFFPSRALEKNGHWSAGALTTLSWALAGGHSLAVGFDGEYTRGYLIEFQSRPTIGTFTQGTHYDFTVRARVLAPYVHGEWQLTPALRITTGLRIEQTVYDYDNRTLSNTVGRFKRPADRRDTFWTVTPKLGASLALSESATVYLAYSRGARAPQTADLYRLQSRQNVGDVRPESLDNIELGARGTWGALRYDITAFAQWKRNFFFRDADGFNVPDGRTRHRGVEFSAALPFARYFEASVSGTYAHHTYAFDRPVSADVTDSIRRGNTIDTAPAWLVNAALYFRPTRAVEISLDWSHVGRYFTDAANLHDYPGHDVLNLRASWKVADHIEVFGAIRNLTNTDYAERADFAFGTERYFPSEDRHYEAGLRVSF